MSYEYTVVGAGPAGILAVVRILEKQLQHSKTFLESCHLAKKICWVDPSFTVGAFGQQWKNVPGNTAVEKYQAVYKDIYRILKDYGISYPESHFQIDFEDAKHPTLLKTAAEPLLWITKKLIKLVTPIQTTTQKINTVSDGLAITLHKNDSTEVIYSKRCILAIGGEPRTLSLPHHLNSKIVPLETALDLECLKQYFETHPAHSNSCALVQGSSHSAALAVRNLLMCGMSVKQIMNKPYYYYHVQQNSDGSTHIQHDNDGLKGKAADFTQLLESGKIFSGKWTAEIQTKTTAIDYSAYSHIVFAIGLKACHSLMINGIASSQISYHPYTSETEIPGVFVVGVGHPPMASDGTKNVGVGKFWPDMGKAVCVWDEKPHA